MPPSQTTRTARLVERFAGSRPVRRAADELFLRYARQRVQLLDERNVARTQSRTLMRLVRKAAGTRFGRDHGFDHITSVADYQKRVPIRDYEAFWTGYWRDVFPRLQGSTWPEAIPYYALSSGTTSGATKYIPVSRQMLASNQKAALTTLALFRNAVHDARVFAGQFFFLGGCTDLRKQADGSLAGDLSGIAACEASTFLRPYTFPPLQLGLINDWEQKVQLLAERSAGMNVTALSGIPSWMLILFDRLKRLTGRSRITDVWPNLRLIVHGGIKFDPYRELFRQETGSDRVTFVETYPCSEGFVATEDPRHELLRIVPDHGIFFEFVPADELGTDRPTRHTLANLEPGVNYAVVLTTCAGLWGYVVGDTVRFERRNPPLLRFTGRTKYFLSAFGEHIISEEVEKAVTVAAHATGAQAIDFHVGPVFPADPRRPGHHQYFVEFATPPADLAAFGRELDAELSRLNEDYAAHRVNDLSMMPPEVSAVRPGGFAEWMKSRGKFGGQNKVPRMDNSGQITKQLAEWLGNVGPR
jgi:hypothetical protein